MQLFGGNMGAKAVVALPFALRRKLVNRYLTSVRMRVDEAVALAAETVPFYRRQYGGTRPRTLGEAPVVTEEMLRRTSPQHLLSVQMKEAPIFAVRSRNGAPGYFCATDLMTLGAAALLHPQAGELAASFRTSRMCLNALPYAGSLLGPCAERLVRFLGGCVLNVAGMPEEAVLAALELEGCAPEP